MKKTGIRHVVSCVAFLLGFVALLAALSFLYRPRNNTNEAGMSYMMANGYLGEPYLDVCFVGSSEFYSGISPMRIWEQSGIASYDVAIGAQRVYQTNAYVNRILKTHHPKVIVVDGYVALKQGNPSELIYTEMNERFPIFENHENWKRFNWSLFTAPVEYTHREINKGFRARGDVVKVSFRNYMNPSKEKEFLSPINRFYLDQIKRTCDEHGVELMFLALPSPKNWDYPHHNTLQDYSDQIGVRFLDLNLLVKELGIDPKRDFRDAGDHLNGEGTRKVSVYLAQYLREEFGLEDHSEDEAYAHWNDDYQHYPD